MAEEDDWRARLLGGDQAVHGPEVADDLVPPALVGEMAEVGAGRAWPVSPMIIGVNGVACGVERRGETRVTPAMLGEAVGDLDHRARRRVWQPATRQEVLAIVGAKHEFASRHSVPLNLSFPSPWEGLGISRVCAGGVKLVGAGEILLAELIGIG